MDASEQQELNEPEGRNEPGANPRARRARPAPPTMSGADNLTVLHFLNQPMAADDMAAALDIQEPAAQTALAEVIAARERFGGVFRSYGDATEALDPERRAELIAAIRQRAQRNEEAVEPERVQFKSLLLANPNYFGNLEESPFTPVKAIQGNTSYEELVCVGLDPPYDRLEAVLQVKKEAGYGGSICGPGTREYVRFYVDLHDNGVWHDVGLANVRVHDIPGSKPLCYAVRRDFDAFKKFCLTENIVRVRAILQWSSPPPANTPGHIPVWGNVLNAQVQIHPLKIWLFGDLVKEFQQLKVKLPDPIGPVIGELDPAVPLAFVEQPPLTIAQKQELYREKGVPVHRMAFQEVQQLLTMEDPAVVVAPGQSALVNLGLDIADLDDLVVKLFPTDGDTSYEELRCVGLHPESGLLEAVLTVKKPTGFSGPLCGPGSTEYVAFWIDFNDGGGFQYMGTSTLSVHDLATIPDEDLQYSVFLKKDLSQYQVPCEIGARVVRLRAILSWNAAPPPGNPNYVPVWGNREECLVQLQPGELVGHIPLIETIGDIGVDDINQLPVPNNEYIGLATGSGQIGAFSVVDSPFGGVVTITGRIGNPPNSFGGGANPFKYRIEVFGPPPYNSWQPLMNPITVKVSEWFLGIPVMCAPGDFVCDVTLTPTDDGDGLGPGWYEYLEDIQGPNQRFLVVDKLASWFTNSAMEGLWSIRITAKDPVGPTVFPGVQVVQVRIDNTPPSGPVGPGATPAQIEADPPLTITGATLDGNPIPAADCGKFPVGAIIEGTYEVHDPGLVSPDQHFNWLSLSVIPAGPANGATPSPSFRSYPIPVPTTGESGTWTLDTSAMDPCGYVVRLVAYDRTNVNSTGYHYHLVYDVGFCLEEQ